MAMEAFHCVLLTMPEGTEFYFVGGGVGENSNLPDAIATLEVRSNRLVFIHNKM